METVTNQVSTQEAAHAPGRRATRTITCFGHLAGRSPRRSGRNQNSGSIFGWENLLRENKNHQTNPFCNLEAFYNHNGLFPFRTKPKGKTNPFSLGAPPGLNPPIHQPTNPTVVPGRAKSRRGPNANSFSRWHSPRRVLLRKPTLML
jgi:hypothetical protein